MAGSEHGRRPLSLAETSFDVLESFSSEVFQRGFAARIGRPRRCGQGPPITVLKYLGLIGRGDGPFGPVHHYGPSPRKSMEFPARSAPPAEASLSLVAAPLNRVDFRHVSEYA
jgi:hypothetical protein